jgi:DNA-binding beta-propeller fold protein YncE
MGGDWIIIDSNSEYIYVPAAVSNNVTKVNLLTGPHEWTTSTGIGPYGGTLNADETEISVSNKGETGYFLGRTITVIETVAGRRYITNRFEQATAIKPIDPPPKLPPV